MAQVHVPAEVPAIPPPVDSPRLYLLTRDWSLYWWWSVDSRLVIVLVVVC